MVFSGSRLAAAKYTLESDRCVHGGIGGAVNQHGPQGLHGRALPDSGNPDFDKCQQTNAIVRLILLRRVSGARNVVPAVRWMRLAWLRWLGAHDWRVTTGGRLAIAGGFQQVILCGLTPVCLHLFHTMDLNSLELRLLGVFGGCGSAVRQCRTIERPCPKNPYAVARGAHPTRRRYRFSAQAE